MNPSLQFFIPKGTLVWFHAQGEPFNIYTNFTQKITDKDVMFTLEDLWFLPKGENVRLTPASIDQDTPEGWPKDLERAIGFKLPENSLHIDYIVAKFGDIQWKQYALTGKDEPTDLEATIYPEAHDERHDAAKILRKSHQHDKGFYFPGKLPS